MARRPRRSPEEPHGTSGEDGAPVDPNAPARDRIIAALMALAAERSIEEIGCADIAGRAGVSLADLRQEFGSKLAILAAYVKDIDRKF